MPGFRRELVNMSVDLKKLSKLAKLSRTKILWWTFWGPFNRWRRYWWSMAHDLRGGADINFCERRVSRVKQVFKKQTSFPSESSLTTSITCDVPHCLYDKTKSFVLLFTVFHFMRSGNQNQEKVLSAVKRDRCVWACSGGHVFGSNCSPFTRRLQSGCKMPRYNYNNNCSYYYYNNNNNKR